MLRTLSTFVLLSSVIVRAQGVPDAVYLKFNEAVGSATVVNSASGGPTPPPGVVVGNMTFVAGRYGNAVRGTGGAGNTNHVNSGYFLNIASTATPWTMEWWFQPASVAATQYLAGVGGPSLFRVSAGAGAGNGIVIAGTGINSLTVASAVPPVGVWVHVAVVNDPSTSPPTLRSYLNGIPWSSIANTPSTASAVTGPLYVGSHGAATTGLNGLMDDFRWWTTARTAADILANYNDEMSADNAFTATSTGGGVGDLVLDLDRISTGAVGGYTLVSTDATWAVGTGPLFGLVPSAATWSLLGTPSVLGNPLHFPVIAGSGVYPDAPFTVPAGTLSALAGQSWDFVVVLYGTGGAYVGRSAARRVAF